MEQYRITPEAESEQGQSFEAQFALREHFDVAGGNAEVIDIKPEKIKDKVPVLWAPAWGLNVDVYKRSLEELSEQERRVVSLTHPRKGGDLESRSSEEELEKYPKEELRKAYNIIEIIEGKKIDKIDAIAHSEGGVNITIAATLRPDLFRNIVYYAPAGMIGKDKFIRLLQGFAGQGKRAESIKDYPVSEDEKETGAAAAKSAVEYLVSNPLRAYKEVKEIADSQIHEMLTYLHEKGIGIVVMTPEDDPVFPQKLVIDQMTKSNMMDLCVTTKGGHGGIGDQPEKFTVQAEMMLSALQYQNEHAVDGVKPDIRDYFEARNNSEDPTTL